MPRIRNSGENVVPISIDKHRRHRREEIAVIIPLSSAAQAREALLSFEAAIALSLVILAKASSYGGGYTDSEALAGIATAIRAAAQLVGG